MARKPTTKVDDQPTLQIKWVPVDSIHLNPRNPRDNEKGVDKVAKSIERFGWQQPIVVNAAGTILAGNTRYKAAVSLGMKEVPITPFTGTKEQEMAFLVADNKVRDYSKWIDDQLANVLAELEGEDLDATGFSQRELEKLLADDEAELMANGEGSNAADPEAAAADFEYRIIVNCKGEEHQAELIAAFEEMGLGDCIQAQML